MIFDANQKFPNSFMLGNQNIKFMMEKILKIRILCIYVYMYIKKMKLKYN